MYTLSQSFDVDSEGALELVETVESSRSVTSGGTLSSLTLRLLNVLFLRKESICSVDCIFRVLLFHSCLSILHFTLPGFVRKIVNYEEAVQPDVNPRRHVAKMKSDDEPEMNVCCRCRVSCFAAA